MKEKGILFSGPMVRAILDGSKTQTRRVMKPQPYQRGGWWYFSAPSIGLVEGMQTCAPDQDPMFTIGCPYGVPGDTLWVRETWMPFTEDGDPTGVALYRATDTPEPDGDRPLKWRPSTSMPRWASRLGLLLTEVGVEKTTETDDNGGRTWDEPVWAWALTFEVKK